MLPKAVPQSEDLAWHVKIKCYISKGCGTCLLYSWFLERLDCWSTGFSMWNFKVTAHNKKRTEFSMSPNSHLKTHTRTEAKCREYTQFIYSFWWSFVSLCICVCGRTWHPSMTDSSAVKTRQAKKKRKKRNEEETDAERNKSVEGVGGKKDKGTQESQQKKSDERGRTWEKKWERTQKHRW